MTPGTLPGKSRAQLKNLPYFLEEKPLDIRSPFGSHILGVHMYLVYVNLSHPLEVFQGLSLPTFHDEVLLFVLLETISKSRMDEKYL